jgi:hypothetical protein
MEAAVAVNAALMMLSSFSVPLTVSRLETKW